MIKSVGDELGLEMHVYGPETHGTPPFCVMNVDCSERYRAHGSARKEYTP